VAVFGHTAGNLYQVRYRTGTAAQTGIAAGSGRFNRVNVPAAAVSGPELYCRTSTTGAWSEYSGDWALYDGFVTETTAADVEVTLRTAPETVSPSSPKFFDTVYFEGADEGMSLTVSDEIWVRPVFCAQPTEGARVTFADVAAHDATGMDFIDAMRQMFNLCFHTDNRARIVRIEPRGDFHSEAEMIDWTERIDLDRPVTVEELGGDLAKTMTWQYRTGDGAVAGHNRSTGESFGRWSAAVEHTAAAELSVWENPMFTPSLNTAGYCPGAPSASVVQAGDPSRATLDRTENLNFAPKVVRYEGMKPLSTGEVWDWPGEGALYPKIAFHAPEGGYTLCFEDRDGCVGLHSHYDRDVRIWNNSRRLTLWLALSPVDVESIAFPTGAGAGFNTLYRLDLDGEQGLYTLEEVCGYDPAASSTKCVFIKKI
jgi:hypothetical protein